MTLIAVVYLLGFSFVTFVVHTLLDVLFQDWE
jgi:hypothetical protein